MVKDIKEEKYQGHEAMPHSDKHKQMIFPTEEDAHQWAAQRHFAKDTYSVRAAKRGKRFQILIKGANWR